MSLTNPNHNFLVCFSQIEAVDVDIDEILDMDSDEIRRSYLYVSFGLHRGL